MTQNGTVRQQSDLFGFGSKGRDSGVPVVAVRLVREGTVNYGGGRLETSQQAADAFRQLMEDMDRESVWLACLSAKNVITSFHCVSVGHLTGSLIHPREVFKAAILANASAIMIAHNHPSGDPTPSKEDSAITRRLREAAEILSIRFLDHIILGSDSHWSYCDRGLMGESYVSPIALAASEPAPVKTTKAFALGQTVCTPGALEAVSESQRLRALSRHMKGDWGNVSPEDKAANDAALEDGGRLLSSYETASGTKFWIITDAEDDDGRRAATTFLLSEEY